MNEGVRSGATHLVDRHVLGASGLLTTVNHHGGRTARLLSDWIRGYHLSKERCEVELRTFSSGSVSEKLFTDAPLLLPQQPSFLITFNHSALS